MVPQFYDVPDSERSDEEVVSLRQVCPRHDYGWLKPCLKLSPAQSLAFARRVEGRTGRFALASTSGRTPGAVCYEWALD